jgi:hypothetical protein
VRTRTLIQSRGQSGSADIGSAIAAACVIDERATLAASFAAGVAVWDAGGLPSVREPTGQGCRRSMRFAIPALSHRRAHRHPRSPMGGASLEATQSAACVSSTRVRHWSRGFPRVAGEGGGGWRRSVPTSARVLVTSLAGRSGVGRWRGLPSQLDIVFARPRNR